MGIDQVKKRAVFLDRDGIINESIVREGKPYPPATEQELRFTDGIAETLAELKKMGFLLIVVTNQPDVARKTASLDEIERMHDRIKRELPVDAVYSCFHDSGDNCDCRKPRPGMLLAAARDLNIDLAASYMVGDRWRDIDAGKEAGCKTIFVDYGYDEALRARPDFVTDAAGKMISFIK